LPFVSLSTKRKNRRWKIPYANDVTPSDFLLIFCISKYGGEMAFLLVPGNSQFVIKAHSKFIYNTSGCNCIKTNTFKALNKNHNRGHILDVLRVLGWYEIPHGNLGLLNSLGTLIKLSQPLPISFPQPNVSPSIIPNPLLLKK
jgi:hypothetical protein